MCHLQRLIAVDLRARADPLVDAAELLKQSLRLPLLEYVRVLRAHDALPARTAAAVRILLAPQIQLRLHVRFQVVLVLLVLHVHPVVLDKVLCGRLGVRRPVI